jgi:polynucleotide 5'-kinase involved in rRNA processing
MRETGDATARLVARAAEAGCTRVLVDTSGLVEGSFGLALKRIKIDRVRPDLIIALQRAHECEPIVRLYENAITVLRLPAAKAGKRTQAERRRRRQRALDAHLAGAVPVPLDLTRVPARPAPSTRGLAVVEVLGALVGLDDREGRTRGLGWVSALDVGKARLTVETAVESEGIAAVAIGRERYRVA